MKHLDDQFALDSNHRINYAFEFIGDQRVHIVQLTWHMAG